MTTLGRGRRVDLGHSCVAKQWNFLRTFVGRRCQRLFGGGEGRGAGERLLGLHGGRGRNRGHIALRLQVVVFVAPVNLVSNFNFRGQEMDVGIDRCWLLRGGVPVVVGIFVALVVLRVVVLLVVPARRLESAVSFLGRRLLACWALKAQPMKLSIVKSDEALEDRAQ